MLIPSAWAQTASAAAPIGAGLTLGSFLPFILMFAVLYLFMIRPQLNKQKEHRRMIEALVVGDEIVTIGGLLGRVAGLDENYIQLEISKGVVVKVQRSAVVQVLPRGNVS